MKVNVFSINTTDGLRFGLKSANDGYVLASAPAKFKTERGAVAAAKRLGHEVVR
jgi:hypothetical protein